MQYGPFSVVRVVYAFRLNVEQLFELFVRPLFLDRIFRIYPYFFTITEIDSETRLIVYKNSELGTINATTTIISTK